MPRKWIINKQQIYSWSSCFGGGITWFYDPAALLSLQTRGLTLTHKHGLCLFLQLHPRDLYNPLMWLHAVCCLCCLLDAFQQNSTEDCVCVCPCRGFKTQSRKSILSINARRRGKTRKRFAIMELVSAALATFVSQIFTKDQILCALNSKIVSYL